MPYNQENTMNHRILNSMLIAFLLFTLAGCAELPATLPPNPIPTLLPTLLSLIPSSTPLPPTPSPTPRGTVNPLTAPVTGESMFEFIHETVPDGTRFEPGQTFSKTWTYRNEGPLKWTRNYAFLRISSQPEDTAIISPAQVDFARDVSPGQEVELTVDFTAPQEPGIYSVVYQIMNERGELLEGTESWVTIVVGDISSLTSTTSAQINAVLKQGSFDQGIAAIDFCMQMPDQRAWYPWNVTLNFEGKAISPEGSLIEPATATTPNKCFRYTFPVIELLNEGKPFTLNIEEVSLPPEVNQAENCARAKETLTDQYPGLDFACSGPGNFYTGLVLPEGLSAEQADTLILDAMSSAIYGPWMLSGTFE